MNKTINTSRPIGIQQYAKHKQEAKRKKTASNNPFDNFSFWLTMATINYGFLDIKKKNKDDQKN